MFLPLELFFRLLDWAHYHRTPLCHFLFSPRLFYREVPGFETDCPCGFCCRGLPTCLVYVGPHIWKSNFKPWLVCKFDITENAFFIGTRTWYSYSQYSSTEFLILHLFRNREFQSNSTCTCTSTRGQVPQGTPVGTGPSTNILWYICDIRVKTIIAVK